MRMPVSRRIGHVRVFVAAVLALASVARAQDATPDGARAVDDTLDPRTRQSAAWFAALERVNDRIRASPISWLDGHLGVTSRIRMSRDGARAVSWAEDGSAWLWNSWTGEPLGLLGMFGMGETSSRYGAQLRWPHFQFSDDGERILVYEPLARFAGLWDGRSAEFLAHLEVADEKASDATLSPDGRRIAVASETGVIRFYDSERGLPLDTPVLE
jgi:WD40 repeat protein